MNIKEDEIRRLLLQYEKDFMSCKFCNHKNNLMNRIGDNFIEVGSSGNIYNKKDMVEFLSNISSDRKIDISDFQIVILSETVVLARYKAYLQDNDKTSFHSSIWKFDTINWRIVYHQGTVTAQSI